MTLKTEANGNYIPYSRQQTFLGATIVNFTLNAGFEDSASSINVELVVDEFNKNDTTLLGFGQDIYHDGVADKFRPPPVGSPVFFAYGPSGYPITMHGSPQSYDISAFEDATTLTFGGILQSYRKTQSATDGVRFSAVVNDPKEVLSNVQLVLRNYTGSSFATPNLLNIYGFLEHNRTDQELSQAGAMTTGRIGSDTTLGTESIPTSKVINPTSFEDNVQNQAFRFGVDKSLIRSLMQSDVNVQLLTGTGFSRQGEGGIPFYRIAQTLRAFNGEYSTLPAQYTQYNNQIKFRGFKYGLDFSNLPLIPPFYMFDYDTINLLDFLMEVGEVSNHDIFVDLHPVQKGGNSSLDAIIVLRTVNRSNPLPANTTHVKGVIESIANPESTDVGYELASVPTNKFVVGSQRVDPYIFKKNTLPFHNSNNLLSILTKSIIPYYGLLPGGAVTIPKGDGPFKQIKIDATSLAANGVGNFYIATEMELRHAKIGFKEWSEFLLSYDSKFLETTAGNDISDNMDFERDEDNVEVGLIENKYAVTVPRCRFGLNSQEVQDKVGDPTPNFDGSCHPPYGYPLYWNRATQVGLPQAGLSGLTDRATTVIKDAEILLENTKNKTVLDDKLKKYNQTARPLNRLEARIANELQSVRDGNPPNAAFLKDVIGDASVFLAVSKKLAKNSLENAQKVHAFLQNIANECLGKKYLVKIPQRINVSWDGLNTTQEDLSSKGPFGFPPPNKLATLQTDGSFDFVSEIMSEISANPDYIFQMNKGKNDGGYTYDYFVEGSLKVGLNPMTNLFEYNYLPEPQGSFYNEYVGTVTMYQKNAYMPLDLTSFMENGRLQAYVRFDNSQFMSFEKVGGGTFRQLLTDPKMNTDLSNMGFTSRSLSTTSSNPILEDALDPDDIDSQSITFVKCTLDSEFYHAPNIVTESKPLFNTVSKKILRALPKKVRDKNGEIKEVVKGSRWLFSPTNDASSSYNITDMGLGKDKDHVYALITLPGQIELTQNNILGQKKQPGVLSYMHLLFEDAPKSAHADPGFDSLQGTTANAYPPDFESLNYRMTYSREIAGNNATAAEKKVYEGITFASHRINIAAPSPIDPDYAIIPLLSRERAYGPWTTKYVYENEGENRTFDIGGQVEFVKDESIAPWNFDGYVNMNIYGDSLASFDQNPRLFSELGSFTVPEAPVGGYSLGTQIGPAGSLITNISVNISPDSIRSTYQLATYTQGFGKMKKQVQDKIKLISRQAAKMRDSANQSIRKGISKSKNDVNYQVLYNSLNQNMDYGDFSRSSLNSPMTINSRSNLRVSSSVKKKIVGEGEDTDDDGLSKPVEGDETHTETSDMSGDDMSQNADTLAQHPELYCRNFGDSAIDEKGKQDIAVSLEGFHHVLPFSDITSMDSVDYDDEINDVVNNDYHDA